jgi:nitroimidazol reductase NimA-like FMN-containing flavoprotein (pyridoxamine 5'-phosphate oxidase superfamily)
MLCIRPSDSNGKVIPYYKCVWIDGQIQVVPHPKQHESLVQHAHEELGRLGIQFTHSLIQTQY